MTEIQRHIDFQEIRLQEKSQSLAMGVAPQAVDVIVQDELVDICQAGGLPPRSLHLV